MYRLFILCTLFLGVSCGTPLKTSLEDLHLQGPVQTVREESFKAVEKDGNFVKGEKESFTVNNNLLCFRKDGNIEKRCEYWSNDEIRYCMYYSYDIEGFIREIKLHTSENKMISRALYEYDSDDCVCKATYFDQGNFVKDFWQYEYDEDGNQIAQYHYTTDKKLLEKYMFTYDERGYCMEQINCNGDGSARSRFEYTRDERGNQLQCIWYSESGVRDFKYDYQYDEYDNQINIKIYKDESDVLFMETSYQYEYDEYKNWICCYEWSDGKMKKIKERKITYYKK